MENNIEDKDSFGKIKSWLISKKNYIISIFTIAIFVLIGAYSLDIYKKKENKKISEMYIKAGIQLSSNNKVQSKEILKEIIYKKDNFYSLLALNNIIENDLETNSDEILKLFSIIEKIKIDNDQKDLVKLKKALYLIKISKKQEANNLLEEIITRGSIWKDTALKISKE